MKNGNENFFIYNNNSAKCSICKLEKIKINISKIKDNKLKMLLSKINDDELINKCKCSNDQKQVHKICLLFKIIFKFEVQCRLCKYNYNIKINKTVNNSKKLCKLFSYLFLTLFHILLIVASVILIIYPLFIKKDLKDKSESRPYVYIYIFFGIIIFLTNLLLMAITYTNFIDEKENDIFDYTINVSEEDEQNNNKPVKYYLLLRQYYRYFHNARIRYLINKKHRSLFFDSGYGNYNKEISKMIQDSHEILNDEIMSLNKKQITSHVEQKEIHYTGTLGNFNHFKNADNHNNSYENNSKNTNPINLQLSLIKKNFEENDHKENMDDFLIINSNLNNDNDNKKKNEKSSFNSISIYKNNNKYNIISKSCFYKKLDINKISKTRTYKTRSDRKKSQKENSIKIKKNESKKKNIKLNVSGSEKKYIDSTSLLKNEKDKEQEKDKDKDKAKPHNQ